MWLDENINKLDVVCNLSNHIIMELGKARSTEEIIKDIKSTLETKVNDNVATHGGEINFLSYDQGIVRLQMAGACSGCAMSKKTLQEGGERLLTHYVPEVIGLLSEDDEEAKHKGYTPYFPKEVPIDLSKSNCN